MTHGAMNKKILVVDDEQGYLDLYRYMMEPMGIEVVCVKNGQEAVEKVTEKLFDLILMDVHMPVMTGPEAYRRIRQIRPGQKVVIFSSSSDVTHSQEDEMLKEGVLTCLYKPVAMEDIEKILEQNMTS